MINAKTRYEEIRAMVERQITGAQSNSPANAEQETAGATPESLAGHSQGRAPQGKAPRHPVSRMSATPRSELAQHYNELHALIVRVGNQHCRKTAKCEECPLRGFLPPTSSGTKHHI
jgi:endonuclease III-like uncharacterized protein